MRSPAAASSASLHAWLTAALVAAFAAFFLCYWPVLTKLVYDWGHDDNYSHGFLIVPLALYFVWERRAALLSAPVKQSWVGLVIAVLSLALLVAGQLGAELFVTRMSIIGLLVGSVLFVCGWHVLRLLWFPLAFLLLMVPPPAIIFNQIAFPLQLLASRFGEVTLQAFSIPVLREGNVMELANTRLEVAEACSGIRSLISLLTLGIVYGYFVDRRGVVRAIIALSTIPIAIVTNGLRVAGTGLAAHYYGPEAAEGFFHTFSGWLVFIAAFALLFVVVQVIRRLAPDRRPVGTRVDPVPV
jgi:exosortase